MLPLERGANPTIPVVPSVNGRPAPGAYADERPRPVLPIAPEGWPFVLVPLAIGLIPAALGQRRLAAPALGVAAFMAYFFRDPERCPPPVAGAVLAPADGRVVEVREEFEDPFVGQAHEVSIFLSPLDVHVNRFPIGGEVVAVDSRRGAFLPANRPDASERNEQTSVAIQGEGTTRVVVRQVAGILARRIVCRVRVGDRLRAGERFGMIKFGSRTDVVFPASARLTVRTGDRVRAGETIVGLLP